MVFKGMRYVAIVMAILVASAFGQSTIDSLLVAYWPFERLSAPFATIDESGNGYDLLAMDSLSNVRWLPGPYGNYTYIMGGGAKLAAKESMGRFNSKKFTVAAFIQLYGTGKTVTIFQNAAACGGVKSGYCVQIMADNSVQVVFGDSASGSWRTVSTGRKVSGVTHCAITYDGANVRLYLNGSLASTTSYTGSFSPASGPAIVCGASIDGQYSNLFRDNIDEVRIYSRVLSPTQISTLAHPPAPNAAGYWKATQTAETHVPWNGSFHLTQIQGDTIITGTAEMPDTIDHTTMGTVQGSMHGNKATLNVTWEGGIVGIYNGTALTYGRLMFGAGYDKNIPSHVEQWTAAKVYAVPSVSGCWKFHQSNMGADTGTLNLTQDTSGKVTGSAHYAAYNSVSVTGAVKGQNLTFSIDWGNNSIGDYTALIGLDSTSLRHGHSAAHGQDPQTSGVTWTGARIACH